MARTHPRHDLRLTNQRFRSFVWLVFNASLRSVAILPGLASARQLLCCT